MFFHLIFFLEFRVFIAIYFVFLVRIRNLVFRYDFVSLENSPFLPYFGHFDAFRSFRPSMRIIQALSARNHPSVALFLFWIISFFCILFPCLYRLPLPFYVMSFACLGAGHISSGFAAFCLLHLYISMASHTAPIS